MDVEPNLGRMVVVNVAPDVVGLEGNAGTDCFKFVPGDPPLEHVVAAHGDSCLLCS